MNDKGQKKLAGYGKPARFINHFSVAFGPGISRVALGELHGTDESDAFYSDVFAMPTERLVNLARLVLQAAANMQQVNQVQRPGPLEVGKFGRERAN